MDVEEKDKQDINNYKAERIRFIIESQFDLEILLKRHEIVNILEEIKVGEKLLAQLKQGSE